MKNKSLILVFMVMVSPLAVSGCYTQTASMDEDDERSGYTASEDTSGGQTIINNYYGSDSYRDWRYRSSFRYYHPRPYWAWGFGWNDSYWDSDFDFGYGFGWDPWIQPGFGYPYGYHPWNHRPGYPPYGFYSDRYYGDPYYSGSGHYGIPVTVYSGSIVPGRRRTSGPTRGDAGPRTIGNPGGVPSASAPAVGGQSMQPRPGAGVADQDRPVIRQRQRADQETPWWERADRQRVKTDAEQPTIAPRARGANGNAARADQSQPKRDRSGIAPRKSGSNDPAQARRPRSEPTVAPRQDNHPRSQTRTQSGESVSTQSREAPRSAPATRENTARPRKAD